MAERIAPGADDAGEAVLIDAEKTVRRAARAWRRARSAACRRSVLEADRHGKSAGHLAMGLAFGRARADRGPGDQVGDVLRHDGVEEFGGRGEAEFGDFEEELAADAEAGLDVVRAVEVRIVDQAFPADGRAGLLEIDPHDDEEAVGSSWHRPSRRAYSMAPFGSWTEQGPTRRAGGDRGGGECA